MQHGWEVGDQTISALVECDDENSSDQYAWTDRKPGGDKYEG